MAKAKSAKKIDHVRHKIVPSERCECQTPSQRRYGKGNKGCATRAVLYGSAIWATELEILKVWEESNEV